MLSTPAEWMHNTLGYLLERYGSVDAYLTGHLGLTLGELASIRGTLLSD